MHAATLTLLLERGVIRTRNRRAGDLADLSASEVGLTGSTGRVPRTTRHTHRGRREGRRKRDPLRSHSCVRPH